MYLYFNNERKLQTMIAHGSPVRQGDSFGLYVCFDLDFFNDASNLPYLTGAEYLVLHYKRPADLGFSSSAITLQRQGTLKFSKLSDSEVTYKLKDGEKYLVYYASIPATSELTQQPGNVDFVFKFITTGEQVFENNTNEINFTAKVYVEPTYGKNKVQVDSSLNLSNYEDLIARISTLATEKNICIEQMEYNTSEVTDEYATIQDRAEYIFETYATTKIGWIIVGIKSDVTVDPETLEKEIEHKNTDLFFMIDETTMAIFEGESGNILVYNNGEISSLYYSINIFGENLPNFLVRIDEDNLADALDNMLTRIVSLETDGVLGIEYTNEVNPANRSIQYQQGGQTKTLVTNAQLKQDLGIDEINTNGVFDVKYYRATNLGEANETAGSLKKKKGSTEAEVEVLNTNQIKEDMKLNLVDNKSSSDSISISEKSNYVATIRALVNTLENGDENTVPNYTRMKNAVESIYQYLEISGDDNNLVDKLEEVIDVLNNIPENSDIYATLTNIFDKIGEGESGDYFYDASLPEAQRGQFTIKGRIDYLYQNADKHIVEFLRYSDQGNQAFLTLPIANWVALSEPNTNYPDAEYYITLNPRAISADNDIFANVLDMELVFDKESEKEYIVGAEFDTETEILTIYANALPEIAITIDTIKMISNVHHTMSMNKGALDQIADNTDRLDGHDVDISNINRDKVSIKVSDGTDDYYSSIDHNSSEITMTVHNDESSDFNFNANSSEFYIDFSMDNNYGYAISYTNTGQFILGGNSNTYNYAKFSDSNIELENRGLNYKSQFAMDSGAIQLMQTKGTGVQENDTIVSLDIKNGKFELTAKKSNGDNTFVQSKMDFDENGSLKIDNNPVILQNTDANTNGQVKSINVDKIGVTLTIKDDTDYDRQVALINDSVVVSGQVQGETYSRGKVDTLLGAKQDVSNLVSSFTAANTTDDTYYPSAKLVDTVKQDKSNIVKSTDNSNNGWNSTLSDDKYPSEKLAKNYIDSKINDTTASSNTSYSSSYVNSHFVPIQTFRENVNIASEIQTNGIYKIDGFLKIVCKIDATGTSDSEDSFLFKNCIIKFVSMPENGTSTSITCQTQYLNNSDATEGWTTKNIAAQITGGSGIYVNSSTITATLTGIITKLN